VHHGMAAVAADVDEPAQGAVLAPHDRHRDLSGDRREEAPRLRDLLRPACVLPGRGEDALVLSREYRLVGVPRRRERPALFERMLELRKSVKNGAHRRACILTVRSVRIPEAPIWVKIAS